MIKLVELANWAAHVPAEEICNLGDAEDYTWSETLFPAGKLETARNKFEKGLRLAFRVPITIIPKVGDAKKSYFDIFLERDDRLSKGQDRYIRNGITIPD